MTDFEFWSKRNIMRDVAIRQDIKNLLPDSAAPSTNFERKNENYVTYKILSPTILSLVFNR
jgi:hypothetical protein